MSEPTAAVEGADVERFVEDFGRVRAEIEKVIVGYREVIESVLVSLFSGGHCLLEGVPGLGKTMLVRTLSQAVELPFSRIQFTPDLMPADIIGTDMVAEDASGRKSFAFQKGPVFAGVVLADEVNRATPKTQSALLEAMQERSVTVGRSTYELPDPFFVMATQNPIEMEGTYPLPEAQLDRFFFKILVSSPSRADLNEITRRTTRHEEPAGSAVLDGERIRRMKEVARSAILADHVRDYASRLVLATHPGTEYASPLVGRFVRFGASPRGAQALILAGKVHALLAGRSNVGYEDIRWAAPSALRHRMLLNFEGEAEGVTPGAVVDDVLGHVAEFQD